MTRSFRWMKKRWWFPTLLGLVGAFLIFGAIRQDDVLSCQRQNPVRDSAVTFYLSEAAKNDGLARSFERTAFVSAHRLRVDKSLDKITKASITSSVAESFARRDTYLQAAADARAAANLPAHLDCGGTFPTDR